MSINQEGRTAKPAQDHTRLSRQGHRLIQLGAALFLVASLQGLVIQDFAIPALGRSVHTLSGLTGVILAVLGLAWPRLKLGAVALALAFWFLVYSSLVTIVAFALAGIWGAGNSIIPIAAGSAHGTGFQEAIITALLYTAAPTGIIAFWLIVWGLRSAPAEG
jgi:(hydroxyamino)benzene mutase